MIPWATTVVGASVMWLAGRRRTRRVAWLLGLANQGLWITFAVATGTWGFVGGSLIYGSVYLGNLIRGER